MLLHAIRTFGHPEVGRRFGVDAGPKTAFQMIYKLPAEPTYVALEGCQQVLECL